MDRSFPTVLPAFSCLALLIFPVGAQEPNQLDGNLTLFSVLAAINAAGYDADLASPNNHPARMAVRQAIAATDVPVLADLKKFVAEHRQSDPSAELSQYISFALSAGGPPGFEYRIGGNQLPPDVAALRGFEILMSRFHREAGIDELWKKAQPALEDLIARYHDPVSRTVLEANAYLRHPPGTFLGRRFQIYLDLLGAPNQIHVRNYMDDYFVVVTPAAEPQVDYIRRVYLQYILDPMVMRQGAELEKKKSLSDYVQEAPALEPHYKSDFALLATASLIRAVEIRLAPASKRAAMVDAAMREGFVLTAHFAESLVGYEKQEQAMRLYLPEMIKSIDLKKEDARLAGIEFASERSRPLAKMPPAPKPPELPGPAKTLAEADALYTERKLEAAKAKYMEALNSGPEREIRAKCLYGLARVATLQKDPETAETLFHQTLEARPDPLTEAWTRVYLARLSEAAGEFEEAERHYRAALGVEGASEGGKKAAQQGLEAVLKKQPQ